MPRRRRWGHRWGGIGALALLAAACAIQASSVELGSKSLYSARHVVARVETEPVPHNGDAADDAAIWVDPDDPSRSTVIGTDKDGGLAVYDLSGRQLQYRSDGELNNVDLRSGFRLGGRTVTLVTAGDRRDNRIAIYTVDAASRRLVRAAARVLTTGIDSYGSCMYVSPTSGRFYYVVTGERRGEFEQWELFDRDGRVDGRMVRHEQIGRGRAEGCVADDEMGRLYVAEENVGIWRYGAEPVAGHARHQVDSTGSGGQLVADVEGLTIAYGDGRSGYLVASSQGDDAFVLYERYGDNRFVDRFRIAAGAERDGAEVTDGIDVTTASLGPQFPGGLFVAQDGRNDGANQNYKLVAWNEIIGSAP
jgi:3-phytase